MEIRELKKLARADIKRRWAEITPENKKLWDEKLFENFFKIEELSDAKTVFAFVSMDNEPDTRRIIERLLSMGKRLCVPKCEGRGVMKAYEIKSLEELKAGKYGIEEPDGNINEIIPRDIDIAIVPCVSADRKLNRLGHGGGYYDRFMEKGSFAKILLSYEKLLMEEVPTENHDIICDHLVTDKDIYKR